ncbi:terminase small subunit [Salmonella enterica]|uniref:Terminase small subunit n=2 Tax=Salmonella enterica TaxID=28901 RepID=A0A607TDD8_SALER|nr:terminase small subunit [Salmonella enterica]EGI6580468.1 terminase small subunit [Salmonella enterica subsp. enterica serovar Typhimurium]EKR5116860.1 terminase small subunit [Escherichia coli]HAB6924576.1 terminase small subunit [Salmonella enterica subsp. enterica serovar Typhi str. CT18]EAN4315927.1 terminase small subunit [Salmonella enterica]EAN9006417.1 terminase small subunit [Salmonella enterica]
MARTNWGEELSRFANEWRQTGIKPKEWSDREGHSWGTAKNHITIKAAKALLSGSGGKIANSGKKSRKKDPQKIANLQSGKEQKSSGCNDARTSKNGSKNTSFSLLLGDADIPFIPDEFGISDQQAKFAMLVAQGKKLVEAYRLAGYESEGNAAYVTASQLLRNPKVYRAISYFRNQYQKRYTADLDLLVSQLMAIVQADPNQLAQFRRVNCRYCWGENHLYQWRDIAEFDKAAAQASRDGKPEPEYGGLGFVDNAIPNPDCPKCCGEGTGQLYMADTTLLDGDARQLYAGAKLGKFGVEILLEDKAAARRELIKLIMATKGSSAGGATDSRNDLELEGLRLRNEKLRTEIENLKKGVGGENNEIIIHNSLPMPGVDNVD